MIDRAALGSWIQHQHLEDERLESYRKTMSTHPARLVVLEDFLVDAKAASVARFLADEAEFAPEHGLYSSEGPVDEQVWEQAGDEDRMFRLSRLAGIPPEHRMSPNALSYLQFRQTFQRPEFAAFFAAATGLELGASDDFGVHAMGTGDFLRAHSDDVKNRRIALVIYLSPEWDPAFGGTLVLTDPDGTDTRVEPRYNSIVIFDVLAETSHLVEPITPKAGERYRFTIGGWYPSSA